MFFKPFIRFFIYTFGFACIIGLATLIYGKIFKLELPKGYLYLLITLSLTFSIFMGIGGAFFAYPKTINLSKNIYSIQQVESKLNSIKYSNSNVEDNTLVFSSTKYMEWFYGKIYVQDNGDNITIMSTRNILNKYFTTTN